MRTMRGLKHLDPAHREAILARLLHWTQLPLLLLAFFMVPLILGPFLWSPTTTELEVLSSLQSLIWVVFAADLAVKLVIAPHKATYLRRHWLDLLVVAVPFLRPLSVINVLVWGSRAVTGARGLLRFDFLIVNGIGLVIVAATVVTTVERGAANATIKSFPDALWWAMTTIATVGYGDMVPVTTAGRAMAVVLMVGGIAMFSTLAATLASHLVRTQGHRKSDLEQLAGEMRGLREEIAKLRAESGKP